jgi:hypothetical protein
VAVAVGLVALIALEVGRAADDDLIVP